MISTRLEKYLYLLTMSDNWMKLFAGFALWTLFSTTIKQIFSEPLRCTKGETSSGLTLVKCEDRYNTDLPDLSSKFGNFQALHIVNAEQFILRRKQFTDFRETLLELIINGLKQFPYYKEKWLSLDEFISLGKLRYFEFSNSKLVDIDAFLWPPNLLKLNLDRNKYTKIRVNNVSNLEEFSANDNELKDLPLLDDPPPPIRALYLNNNPLDDFSIEDIATFCALTHLEAKLPPKSGLLADPCRCFDLQTWVKTFNIEGTQDFLCTGSTKECNRTEFEKARLRREPLCPTKLETFVQSRLKIMLASIISFFILLLVLAYLTYRFLRGTPKPETESPLESIVEEEQISEELSDPES